MDSVVTVSREFLGRMRGFCNAFADICNGCYRRPCSCSLADEIHLAKNLIIEIDSLRNAEEERYYIDNPNELFLDSVEKAIVQGGGTMVGACDIRIPGDYESPDAYRHRKMRALKTLVKRRRITKSVVDGKPFYSINRDGLNTDNNKHKGEADYGIRHEQHQHEGGAQAADDARRG